VEGGRVMVVDETSRTARCKEQGQVMPLVLLFLTCKPSSNGENRQGRISRTSNVIDLSPTGTVESCMLSAVIGSVGALMTSSVRAHHRK
jgi:hypothetical protein